MQLVLYTQICRKVSGLTTFERSFYSKMSQFCSIQYFYKVAETEALATFPTNTVHSQDVGQLIECDICIYSSLQHGFPAPNIKAKKYIQVVHTDLKAWERNYQKDPKVDIYVAVGKSVQKSLKEYYDIDSIVIPNMLETPNEEKVLRLMTASRIAEGKGFDRLVIMAKKLKLAKRKFIWEIFGSGAENFINDIRYKLANIPEVVFMGSVTNIQNYMKVNDYVVQLSDNEGFCYSVHEALQVKVPCITTNFDGVENVIQNGKNGYILEMDLSNLDIDLIYTKIPKSVTVLKETQPERWLELLKL